MLCLLWTWNVSAADIYWTNATSGDFTNQTKWMTTTVPVATDNVFITNEANVTISWLVDATNANVFLASPTGNNDVYTFSVGSSTWWITNSMLVGGTIGSTSEVVLSSGTMVITNASRTATLGLGDLGRGDFSLNGGTLHVDHLYDTNGGALALTKGTLVTYGYSEMSNSAAVNWGGAAGNFTFIMKSTNIFTGAGDLRIGTTAGATAMIHVVGSSVVWSNTSGKAAVLGYQSTAPGNQIIITNGGKMLSGNTLTIGQASASNTVLVAGAGSEARVVTLTVGNGQTDNQLIISNGGFVSSSGTQLLVGGGGSSSNSLLMVTDSGSQLVYSGNDFRVGDNGRGSLLMVSNGGYLRAEGAVVVGQSSPNNKVVVTGAGTIWTNTGGLDLGASGFSNTLIIADGAFVYSGNGTELGATSSDENLAWVTGVGSTWLVGGTLDLGSKGNNNSLVISNGGVVQSTSTTEVGSQLQATNNTIIVTGAGSILKTTVLYVGSNNTSKANGGAYVLINDQATLEVSSGIVSGADGGGTISNRSGTYQFTTATPTITTNTVGSIILTNGILSFKGVTEADINTASVARITFQGDNTFMLNNSTGSLLSAYTFAPGNGANFQHLTMAEGGTRWQATNTTLNSGGRWLFSNTTATVFGVTTNNAGSIKLTSTNGASTTATFEQALVISGTGDGNGAIQHLRATNTIDAPITLMGNSTIHSAAGKLLLAGAITNGGNTLTLGGPGNITATAQISGTGGLTMNGGGSVILSNSAANTFSGATSITNTSVTLSKAGALGSTSGVTLSAAGTLLLSGAAGDRIANTAGLTMDGGTLNPNDISETMGTLTLKSDSLITLTYQSDGVHHDLIFDSGSYVGGTLTISGWNTGPTGEGEDRLYFTNDPGAGFLNNITFTGWSAGARRLSSGYVIPNSAPEPGTVVGGSLLLLLLVVRKCRLNLKRTVDRGDLVKSAGCE